MTIPQILNDNNSVIRIKVAPNSITTAMDAALRDAVALELLFRGVVKLPDTAALGTTASTNFVTAIVENVGIFKDSSTGPANGTTIFAGVGGRFWHKILAPGETVSPKVGSTLLKDAAEISMESQILTGLSRYNEQSGYITNLILEERCANAGISFRDGHLTFYIGGILYWVGGFDNVDVTDQIWFSEDKGATWSLHGETFPYPVANVASLKARYPGDWNYVFGSTLDTGNKRTVIRFKKIGEWEVMTTTAEWGDRLLYGITRDDNGGLYLWFGQTDNGDDTTKLTDAWYSSPQSGGANWVQIQTAVAGFGGCLIDQCQFFNGHHVIVNAGNLMDDDGHTESTKTMVLAVDDSTDKTKWRQVEDCPVASGAMFTATEIFKGLLWMYGGNIDSANINAISYMDKDFKWHSYYNFFQRDYTDLIAEAHASSLIKVDGELLLVAGNGSDTVIALKNSEYSTPGHFRESVSVGNESKISETKNSNSFVIGRGVIASNTSDNEVVRISTEAHNFYLYFSIAEGLVICDLTPSNSTINVPLAIGTGRLVQCDITGVLRSGLGTDPGTVMFHSQKGAHFNGNDLRPSFVWHHNHNTDALGVATGVSNYAWIGGTTDIPLGLMAGNAPRVKVTPTGTKFANSNPANPDACAIVDIESITQGLLLPRMTKTQRDAIGSPTAGLAVYQTDNTPGLRVYNGTNWMRYTETAD